MNEATFREYVPNASKSMIEANKGLLGESVVPQEEQPEETGLQTKSDLALERELARDIVNLLKLRCIEALRNRTDRRSTSTIGWPDLTFCWHGHVQVSISPGYTVTREMVHPCAWEIKLPGRKLSPEQEALKPKLEANGWRYRIIRSVDEALAELKAMGIE